MKIQYGHTTLRCKRCGAVTAIDNRTLEAITAHSCPGCGFSMTDYELCNLKLHLYALWASIYRAHCGPLVFDFDYNINLHPHFEADEQEMEENGSLEGDNYRQTN